MKITAHGHIKNAKFHPIDEQVFKQQLMDAGDKRFCELTILCGKKRTLDANAYLHAICNQISVRLRQDGWDITGYDVYKKIENDYCKDHATNEKTGEVIEIIRALKTMPRDEFFDITEKSRAFYMEKLHIYIKTPAEFYGLTEEAYRQWKFNEVTFKEAQKLSNEDA